MLANRRGSFASEEALCLSPPMGAASPKGPEDWGEGGFLGSPENRSLEGSPTPGPEVWGEFPARAIWPTADFPASLTLFQHLDHRRHFSDAEQGMALGGFPCFEMLGSPSR